MDSYTWVLKKTYFSSEISDKVNAKIKNGMIQKKELDYRVTYDQLFNSKEFPYVSKKYL